MSKIQGSKGISQRQLRVGELIRHALADFFLRDSVSDDELKGVLLTVTEVKASPDLRHATVFLMPSGAADQQKAVAAVARHKKFLRGELARRIELRYVPELAFALDDSFDNARRIEEILHSPEVERDLH
jgi:ribosome-binding factor A